MMNSFAILTRKNSVYKIYATWKHTISLMQMIVLRKNHYGNFFWTFKIMLQTQNEKKKGKWLNLSSCAFGSSAL